MINEDFPLIEGKVRPVNTIIIESTLDVNNESRKISLAHNFNGGGSESVHLSIVDIRRAQ